MWDKLVITTNVCRGCLGEYRIHGHRTQKTNIDSIYSWALIKATCEETPRKPVAL